MSSPWTWTTRWAPASCSAELRPPGLLPALGLHLPLDVPRLGHRLLRVDVGDRVPVGGVALPARGLHPELLGQHGDRDAHLHVAEAGERRDAAGGARSLPDIPADRAGGAPLLRRH